MAPPLLLLDGIRLTFGGTPLLDGADLSVQPGDRIALVGRNGSGKSTLLKIAAGLVEAQDGEVFRHPSATVRYLPQAPDMDGFATVRAYVEAGRGPSDDPHRVTYLLEQLGLGGERRIRRVQPVGHVDRQPDSTDVSGRRATDRACGPWPSAGRTCRP